MPHFIDRAKPGVIAVDLGGRRFTNEANSYHDVVQAMLKACAGKSETACWLVADHRAVRRYGLGFVNPSRCRWASICAAATSSGAVARPNWHDRSGSARPRWKSPSAATTSTHSTGATPISAAAARPTTATRATPCTGRTHASNRCAAGPFTPSSWLPATWARSWASRPTPTRRSSTRRAGPSTASTPPATTPPARWAANTPAPASRSVPVWPPATSPATTSRTWQASRTRMQPRVQRGGRRRLNARDSLPCAAHHCSPARGLYHRRRPRQRPCAALGLARPVPASSSPTNAQTAEATAALIRAEGGGPGAAPWT